MTSVATIGFVNNKLVTKTQRVKSDENVLPNADIKESLKKKRKSHGGTVATPSSKRQRLLAMTSTVVRALRTRGRDLVIHGGRSVLRAAPLTRLPCRMARGLRMGSRRAAISAAQHGKRGGVAAMRTFGKSRQRFMKATTKLRTYGGHLGNQGRCAVRSLIGTLGRMTSRTSISSIVAERPMDVKEDAVNGVTTPDVPSEAGAVKRGALVSDLPETHQPVETDNVSALDAPPSNCAVTCEFPSQAELSQEAHVHVVEAEQAEHSAAVVDDIGAATAPMEAQVSGDTAVMKDVAIVSDGASVANESEHCVATSEALVDDVGTATAVIEIETPGETDVMNPIDAAANNASAVDVSEALRQTEVGQEVLVRAVEVEAEGAGHTEASIDDVGTAAAPQVTGDTDVMKELAVASSETSMLAEANFDEEADAKLVSTEMTLELAAADSLA